MTTTKEEEENKLDDVEEEVTVAKTEKERAARVCYLDLIIVLSLL